MNEIDEEEENAQAKSADESGENTEVKDTPVNESEEAIKLAEPAQIPTTEVEGDETSKMKTAKNSPLRR